MDANRNLFQQEQGLATFKEEPKSEMGRRKVRGPRDPGAKVRSRPCLTHRNRAQSNLGTREETASLKGAQNSETVNHSERDACLLLQTHTDFQRLGRRKQAMEGTKEQRRSLGGSLPKKLDLSWMKSLDRTRTCLQEDRGRKGHVKYHRKGAMG